MSQKLIKNKLTQVIEVLHNTKALEAKVIEVSEHCSYADYFVLVSATSKTHAQAISDQLQNIIKNNSRPEGYNTGQWILNDLGDVIVHIFLHDVRGFYQLDKLWSHAPSIDLDMDHEEEDLMQLDRVVSMQ